jgi:DNA-binding YbaB/EbfC family protein
MNPFDILKNAQKIQEQMSSFQEKLGNIIKTGSAGGGLVEVDINGNLEVLSVRIAPQAVNCADTEMLQDLIMAAFTDGMAKTKEAVSAEAAMMTGGLNIPGFPGAT